MNKDLIIEKQRELNAFYTERLTASATFLYVHGWKELEENIKKGQRLRDELASLESSQKEPAEVSEESTNDKDIIIDELKYEVMELEMKLKKLYNDTEANGFVYCGKCGKLQDNT